MREWLSGGAPPCQGGGRGFDPRLALFLCNKMGTLTGAHFYCISEPSPGLESSISRLPPRSLLLRSFLCLHIYIWKILKLNHFPKKLIPYIKI